LEAVVAWTILVIAGVFEIVWAFSMKQSEGFTRLWPTVVTLFAMLVSFGLLSWSMRMLPLGTAYTIWTGIGAVGAFVVGIVILGESASPARLAAAGMIVGGLLLMKLSPPLDDELASKAACLDRTPLHSAKRWTAPRPCAPICCQRISSRWPDTRPATVTTRRPLSRINAGAGPLLFDLHT
jgi:quaternary ammonium compound-resistance protein SugE